MRTARQNCRPNFAATAIGSICSLMLVAAGADGWSNARGGEIDTRLSRTFIHVGKTGLGHDHAIRGSVKSGNIQLGAPSGAGEIVFDMTSFVADTTEARQYIGLEGTTSASTQKEVNANMRGADVLHVQRFPTATFRIDSALPLAQDPRGGHPRYRLVGEFTLHGVTRPLRVDANVQNQDGVVRVLGVFKVRQTDFGIKPYTKAFGAVGVADELVIHGDMTVVEPATSGRGATRR